ncbi:GGDEF domain-containing protein [Arhodomonas sp. SL1]|uniref:GGDEF domain-containing protein n=1 Tax=Arhodomonas sp. SL1 TaxID=3425691 RepID=UPI003F885B36
MARKRSADEIGERLRQLLIQQEDLRGQLSSLTERMSEEVAELEQRGGAASHETPERRLNMDQVLDLLGHLAVAPTESDASEVIVSAARQLLPGSRGALCLAGEDGTMAVTAVWDAEDQWNRPYRRDLPDTPPRRLANRVSAGPTGEGRVFPARGFGLLVGELRVWPEDDDTAGLWGRCELLARSAGLVLAGMRLQRQLREQSVRDPLTGLLTRGYLMEALPRELDHAASAETSTGLLILDIDRFSVFNDRHGAEVGDRLLVRIGETLRGQSPRAAVSCRYSGERFAVLLPSTPAAEATTRADALRRAIGGLTVSGAEGETATVTVSVGVACAPENARDADALIAAAEAAIFDARQHGGDAVGHAG